jgi:hypothetical protein
VPRMYPVCPRCMCRPNARRHSCSFLLTTDSTMQASQLFLLRSIRKREVEVVGGDDVRAVDARLQALYHALSCSLELRHWRFEEPIKRAIVTSDDGFARLCQAADPLASLVRRACSAKCWVDTLWAAVTVRRGGGHHDRRSREGLKMEASEAH